MRYLNKCININQNNFQISCCRKWTTTFRPIRIKNSDHTWVQCTVYQPLSQLHILQKCLNLEIMKNKLNKSPVTLFYPECRHSTTTGLMSELNVKHPHFPSNWVQFSVSQTLFYGFWRSIKAIRIKMKVNQSFFLGTYCVMMKCVIYYQTIIFKLSCKQYAFILDFCCNLCYFAFLFVFHSFSNSNHSVLFG